MSVTLKCFTLQIVLCFGNVCIKFGWMNLQGPFPRFTGKYIRSCVQTKRRESTGICLSRSWWNRAFPNSHLARLVAETWSVCYCFVMREEERSTKVNWSMQRLKSMLLRTAQFTFEFRHVQSRSLQRILQLLNTVWTMNRLNERKHLIFLLIEITLHEA